MYSTYRRASKFGRIIEFKYSNDDSTLVDSYSWSIDGRGYAIATIEGKIKKLHRMIMGEPEGMEVDHINGNKLDNRRENLRAVTKNQNQWNRATNVNSTSGFRGIGWVKSASKWRVRIQVDGNQISLGRYFDLADAIDVRIKAEIKYFGEYRRKDVQ